MPAFLPAELPVRAVGRHHWIVLFHLPHRYAAAGVLVLALIALIRPWPFAWLLGAILLITAIQRWRLWKADRVYLTGLRVIEVSGVPELTRSERFLRLDRIAGAEISESAWGRVFGFATIELTAPGERVDVRKFAVMADPHEFYLTLRALALGDTSHYHPDEDEAGGDYVTEPLPDVDHGDHRSDRADLRFDSTEQNEHGTWD